MVRCFSTITDPEDSDYVAFSYVELAGILEGLLVDRAASQNNEVFLVVRHYIDMLRRHVVPDEELKSLALRIYERHKEAFDPGFPG